MLNRLYVCSEPILSSDGNLHRHLLGILSKDENDEYQFEYKLGDEDSTNYLMLSIFPRKDKIYTGNDVQLLLDDYLPSEHDTAFMRQLLKKAGMSSYDEWEWLKAFDSDDDDAKTKLYETLPDDVITHEDISEDISESLPIEPDGETSNENESAESNESENKPIETTPDVKDLEEDDFAFGDEDETEYEPIYVKNNIDLDDLFGEYQEEDTSKDNLAPIETVQGLPNVSDKKLFDLPDLDILPDFNKTESKKEEQKKTEDNRKVVKIITKTITKKRKISKGTDDFILPPPDNPFETIQQKLEENQKQRKIQLEQALKSNSYNSNE